MPNVLPLEEIHLLGTTIQRQAELVAQSLTDLRAQCVTPGNFTGTLADKYDQYLSQWDINQRNLITDIENVGHLLVNFAEGVTDNVNRTAGAV